MFNLFRMRIAFLFGFCFFALTAPSLTRATTLLVRVRDENGSPTAARVYLTNQNGDSVFPDGVIICKKLNWDVAEQHFIAPGGVFSVELPAGSYSLRVERGKEYLPIQENISIPPSGKVERTISLQRWVSMAGMGWFSADMHAHVSLQDVAALMQGEDLNVLLPITMWRVSFVPTYVDPSLEDVLAKRILLASFAWPKIAGSLPLTKNSKATSPQSFCPVWAAAPLNSLFLLSKSLNARTSKEPLPTPKKPPRSSFLP